MNSKLFKNLPTDLTNHIEKFQGVKCSLCDEKMTMGNYEKHYKEHRLEDIPFYSGEMKRGYTREQFIELTTRER
jgi:hypothetical protein